MATTKRVDIQWLRALAALEVAIWHSDLVTKHFSDFRISGAWWYQPFGGIGVELFFILSGYVICMRAASYQTGAAFILSRIRRLFPLYAVFTTLVLLAFVINSSWRLNNFDLTFSSIIKSYLILPQLHFPVLGVGWTLEHEMVFYWVVALFMMRFTLHGGPKLAIGWLLAIMGFMGCVQGPPTASSVWVGHLFSPFMFAFAFGWLLRCEEELHIVGRWVNLALLATVLVIALFIGDSWSDDLILRIGAMAAVFFAFTSYRRLFEDDSRANRMAILIGDASFSIYLSHWFILSLVGKVFGIIRPPVITAEMLRLLVVGGSVGVGVLLFKHFERPLDLWLRKREARPSSPPRLPAAALRPASITTD